MRFTLFRYLLGFYLCLPVTAFTQERTDPWFRELIWQKASDSLKQILNNRDSFQYQLIYTRIDRDKKNRPRFTNYFYGYDPARYFNPASTVKMPLAFLALEKINSLQSYGINKHTPMITDSAFQGQTRVLTDTSSRNGLPSVAQYIKKVFLVSDNDAYNRLYEFIGQQTINERLWQMGYTDTRITRRFARMTEEENRHTNPVTFLEHGKTIYQQPAAYNSKPFNFGPPVLIGRAHYDRDEKLVNSPMDFTSHNNISLLSLQQILQSVLFPASVKPGQRFDLKDDDYGFLYHYLSEYPFESRFPNYDTTEFFQSYCKFLYKAGRSRIPDNIRIFNKPGWSYGFLTDVAYVVDFANKIEYMVSGVIYVNSDGILNDDRYEYDQRGYPFFKEIGQIIYEYDLKRKRKHHPDLSRFKIDYGKEE